jgi:hypothetical protein
MVTMIWEKAQVLSKVTMTRVTKMKMTLIITIMISILERSQSEISIVPKSLHLQDVSA